MVDAYSTHGQKLSIGQQAAFGTIQATLLDVRPEEDFTVMPPVKEGVEVNTVTANAQDAEKPLVLQRPVADAVAFKTILRQASTPGDESVIELAFESNGCVAVSGDDTTIATYTSATEVIPTDDNFPAGYGMNVELDDGRFVPALISDNTAGTCTLAMGLPAASSGTKALNKCVTITPGEPDEVSGDKLLSFLTTHRLESGEQVGWQDSSAASADDVELTPGEKIVFGFTFASTKFTESVASMTANDFNDAVAAKVFHDPIFQFGVANSAGAITHASAKLVSATISFPTTTEAVMATGDTAAVNDQCSHLQKYDPKIPIITVVFLYDSQKLDDWNLTNPNKYIAITQPGNSASDPNVSFVLPNAHQIEKPEVDYSTGNKEYQMTIKFRGNPAGYNGTLGSSQGNQSCYFLFGGQSA